MSFLIEAVERDSLEPRGRQLCNCPDRPIASGWLKIGERWRQVPGPCERHLATAVSERGTREGRRVQ